MDFKNVISGLQFGNYIFFATADNTLVRIDLYNLNNVLKRSYLFPIGHISKNWEQKLIIICHQADLHYVDPETLSEVSSFTVSNAIRNVCCNNQSDLLVSTG